MVARVSQRGRCAFASLSAVDFISSAKIRYRFKVSHSGDLE